MAAKKKYLLIAAFIVVTAIIIVICVSILMGGQATDFDGTLVYDRLEAFYG